MSEHHQLVAIDVGYCNTKYAVAGPKAPRVPATWSRTSRPPIRTFLAEWLSRSIQRIEVTEDGRWFVRASYDLGQAFESYLDALNIEPDTEAARDLRGSAEEHLQQLREKQQEEQATQLPESNHNS